MAEEKVKPEQGEAPAEEQKTQKKRSKKKRSVSSGNIYVQASYNNTIITITDESGNAICWASAGSSGFKGSRKSTPYAAQIATENAVEKAKAFGFERAHIFVNGAGNGRDQALRAVSQAGIEIESITETTAIPHNGCRARKKRRV